MPLAEKYVCGAGPRRAHDDSKEPKSPNASKHNIRALHSLNTVKLSRELQLVGISQLAFDD